MGRHVATRVRQRILDRDRHQCQRCGSTGVPLEVNHKDNTRGPGYNRDENLEALCRPCHAVQTRRETLEGQRRRKAAARFPTEKHPAYR